MQFRPHVAEGRTGMKRVEVNWYSSGDDAWCSTSLSSPFVSNKTHSASIIRLSDNAFALLASRLSSQLLPTSAN